MAYAPTSPGSTHRRRSLVALSAALVAGLVLSGALIWRGTSAVWTASTRNDTNSFTAGNLDLADNDSDSAMFNLSGLLPGQTGSACIQVTYSGSGTGVPVKLYAENLDDHTGSLSSYLDLKVETITYTPNVSDPLNCSAGAVSGPTTVYDSTTPSASAATIAHFASTYTGYGSGLAVWTASPSTSKGFRFTYTLKSTTPDTQQNKQTTLDFVWETQVGS